MALSWHWVLVVTQIYRWSFWIYRNNALITFCLLRNSSQRPCTSYIINRITANLKVRWSIPLCVLLFHVTIRLKLRLSFEILMLISDWELLGSRDELPLVMASGQRLATCSTAQPWAIKPDSQEHLKSAAYRSHTWSANVGFSLSPDKFTTVQPGKVVLLRYKPLSFKKKTTTRLKQPQILDSGEEMLEINGV